MNRVMGDMNLSNRGSITIEAAIVMPFVLMIFVSILFFSKIVAIQDEVQSTLYQVAQGLAKDAYITDVLTLKAVQQDLFVDGYSKRKDLGVQGKTLLADAVTLKHQAEYAIDGLRMGEWSALFTKEERTFAETLSEMAGAGAKVSQSLLKMSSEMVHLISNSQEALESAKKAVGPMGVSEVVGLANRFMSEALISHEFNKHLSKEDLKNIGILDGKMDFSGSSLMLLEDTIVVRGSYAIDLPLLRRFFPQGLKVTQEALARAWTGSYDSGETKRIKSQLQLENSIFFIALKSSDNYAYHILSCLRKDLLNGSYEVEVLYEKRSICSYCKGHTKQVDPTMPVYFTSARSKVHLDDYCPRIYSYEIQGLTKEEAEHKGYQACKKPGCADELIRRKP